MGPAKISLILLFTVLFTLKNGKSLELLTTPLPRGLRVMKDYITVSGSDTGGLTAQAMLFSFSKYIKGCAIYSSTFYRCGPANGNLKDFLAACTKELYLPEKQQYKVQDAVRDLKSYETNRLIDSLLHLRYSYIYVYAALSNDLFSAAQQLNVVSLFEHYLQSPYLIKTRAQDTFGELPTVNTTNLAICPYKQQADSTVSKNCSAISAPAEALQFLLGKYIPYVNPFYIPSRPRYIHLEPLNSFNQTEYTAGLDNTGLDEVGYYYVPRQCHGGYSCVLHIYFHGCKEGREFQGTSHVFHSNYLEVAEANKIVMLFPQALSSEKNPGGCFDFVGWTGAYYATKKGPQLQAIWRMVQRLLYVYIN